MKFSKLLRFVLGLSGFFNFGIVEGDSGGGALDASSAASAFEALESAPEADEETQEQAAERLAAEDAQNKEKPAEDDPDESEEQDGEPAPEPDTVTIEVDGKPVQMTKAELAEAVKGQMRQADYTQKTMAAAAETKAAQAEKQAAVAEREKLANQLHTYTVQAQGALANIAAQMTDELLQSDPVHYLMLDRTLKQGQADYAKAETELNDLRKQHQAEQAEKQKEYQIAQHQALLGKLPDWKDPAKAQAEAVKIQAYLQTQDFNGQELGDMNDHRLVVLARKAMMFDDLMTRAGSAAKKVAAAPAKVERPGVPATGKPRTAADAAMKKLSNTGRLSQADAGALFSGFV